MMNIYSLKYIKIIIIVNIWFENLVAGLICLAIIYF